MTGPRITSLHVYETSLGILSPAERYAGRWQVDGVEGERPVTGRANGATFAAVHASCLASAEQAVRDWGAGR